MCECTFLPAVLPTKHMGMEISDVQTNPAAIPTERAPTQSQHDSSDPYKVTLRSLPGRGTVCFQHLQNNLFPTADHPAIWFYKAHVKHWALAWVGFPVFLTKVSAQLVPPASARSATVLPSPGSHLPASGDLWFVLVVVKPALGKQGWSLKPCCLQRHSGKAHPILWQRDNTFYCSSLNKRRSLLTLCQHSTTTCLFLSLLSLGHPRSFFFGSWPWQVSLWIQSASIRSSTCCTSYRQGF